MEEDQVSLLSGEGCTVPDYLERFLHDSSEENESEKHLEENCFSLGLKFGNATQKSGDSFFEAVSSQLRRISLKRRGPARLRKDVVDYLWKNRSFQSTDGTVQIESFLSEDFESWCNRMKKKGEFADPVVVLGMARMLKRDIVIVTSSPNRYQEESVTWIVGESTFYGEPLLLGNYCKNHFRSLELIQKSKRREITTKQRVCDMRSTAKRVREGCTVPDHLERFLHDSSEENESEKHLEENCFSLGLKFGNATQKSGDSFFEAVSFQLRRISLKRGTTRLRKDVVDYLWKNRSFQSTDGTVQIESFLSEDFESWCNRMKEKGEFADPVAVLGMARMLKRDIVIVTSSPNSYPEQTVTWIVGEPNFSGDPLLLGHCCKNHYRSLEPIRKSENREVTTKERVCEMRSNAKRGEGCTNPDHLKRLLQDSSEENESEKHLEENCFSLGLKFGNATQRSGDGFFEAVSSQLSRCCLKRRDPARLRKDVVDYLWKNRSFQSTDGTVQIESFLSEDFESWCNRMKRKGEFADAVVVLGMARMLKRDIVIVTSSPNSYPEQIVTWIVGEPNFSGEPLLLGHCCKNHFRSLELIQKSKMRNVTTKQRVCEMRRTARRAGAYSNPGDLERFLHDHSVLNEMEMRLKQNCSSVGLKFGTKTERNGDCFFEAVSAQLNLTSSQEGLDLQAKTPEVLRQEVVVYVSEKYQTADGRGQIKDFLSEPFKSWCTKMKQKGVFADHLVVVSTAQKLERDIVVVTSASNSNPYENVTWIVGKPDFSGEPLLLGHYWPNYYQCLEPIEKSDHGQKLTKERVTEMRKNAFKVKCSCVKEEKRVKNVAELQPGDHITRPVDHCCLQLCFSHHAIFGDSEDQEMYDGKAKVTLLHYCPVHSSEQKADAIEDNNAELDFQQGVFRTVYENAQNQGQNVIAKAKRLIADHEENETSYRVCVNNCEHFCNESVSRKRESKQVWACLECMRFIIIVVVLKVLRILLVIVSTVADNIIKSLVSHQAWIYIQWTTSGLYLLPFSASLTYSYYKYRKRNDKNECCRKNFKKNILKFCFRLFFFISTLPENIMLTAGCNNRAAELGFAISSCIYGIFLEIFLTCSERCRLRCIEPCVSCSWCRKYYECECLDTHCTYCKYEWSEKCSKCEQCNTLQEKCFTCICCLKDKTITTTEYQSL